MVISKQIILDKIKADIYNYLHEQPENYTITVSDMENILYCILSDIQKEKEKQYAKTILDLSTQLSKLESLPEKAMQEESENDETC